MNENPMQRLIQSQSINNLQTDIPVNTDLKVVFTIPIEKSTINSSNIIIRNHESQEIVTCKYKYTLKDRLLIITPDNVLDPNTRYDVELIGSLSVDSGLRDIYGRTFERNYVFSFTTGNLSNLSAPKQSLPANQSKVFDNVQLEFSWLPVENASYYELQISRKEDFRNKIYPVGLVPVNIYTTSIIPNVELEINNEYWWRVRASTESGLKSEWSLKNNFYYTNTESINIIDDSIDISGEIEEGNGNSESGALSIYKSFPSPRMSNIPIEKLGNIVLNINGIVPEQYINNNYISVYSEAVDGHKYIDTLETDFNFSMFNIDTESKYPSDAADKYLNVSVSGKMEFTLERIVNGQETKIIIKPINKFYYKANNRYYVNVTIPGIDGFFWFTSIYEPMFVTYNGVIKAAFGLLDGVEEDLINYTIRQRSLDAIEQSIQTALYNRKDLWFENWESLFNISNPNRYIRMYVLFKTIVDILGAKFINQITLGGGKITKEIGDLSITRDNSSSKISASDINKMFIGFAEKAEYYDKWIKGHTDPLWTKVTAAVRDTSQWRIDKNNSFYRDIKRYW